MTQTSKKKKELSESKKAYLREYYQKRLKARRQAKREEEKKLPKEERMIEITCQMCGVTVQAKNKNKKYCDDCLRLKRSQYNNSPEIRERLREQARIRYANNPEKYKEYHNKWNREKKQKLQGSEQNEASTSKEHIRRTKTQKSQSTADSEG